MFYKTALLGAASLSLVSSALAQTAPTDETTLDTVIIEGSRLNQAATEVGSSVTIITAEDIDELGFDFAIDAVAAAPGVTVNSNGAFGGVASVRIRGASSEQTLVLIDGVAVNDTSSPGGGFNFARLDTENIERIEVLKGPQSTLWGTDAIGGVVSIITKRPEEGLGGSAFAEYGSFNTFRGGASVGNATETGDFRLAITGTSSDGISKADENNGNTEDDAYEALTLSAKGGLNLGGDLRLAADVLWTDAEAEFDSFSGQAQGSVADGDEVSETEELSANVSLTGSLFDDRLENLVLIGYSDITRENISNGAPSFSAEGDRVLYRYQGTLNINDQNTLAFGAEREETAARGEDISIDGLFALYEFKPNEKVTLTGGLRMDDHERFGSETTGRVAAAYNPTDSLTLRASWGQGFKAPTIFQTTFFCCGATAPNADLQAETSEAFDIGLDWRSPDGKAEAGITYFDQDTENQITFSFAVGGYENIAEVASQGVELYGLYRLTDWLTVSADYAYIDAENGDGEPLVRLPEHSGDLTVSVDPDGPMSGAVLLRYNGEEQNTNGTTLESWTRVDVTGSYDLNESVELFGRIENLFDEEYQQILGYGTPDLSGYLGIRLRY
ncbi:MAG: TonB-dependent receptor plug domain-containing protein [Henriciella sp.]